MTTPEAPILGRIRKLLALAKSGNEHEAASAAARAAELMAEHGLSEAETRLTDANKTAEPIVRSTVEASAADRKAVAWKGSLAQGLAAAHGCKMWWSGAQVVLLGRTSSVQAANYTLSWLVREVERLADQAWEQQHGSGGDIWAPSARTWKGSFRLGAAGRISERLREAARERPELRVVADHRHDRPRTPRLNQEAPGTALVLLARDAEEVCDEYDKVARGFRGAKSFSGARSSDGYGAGRRAGDRVNLASGPGLRAPARRIDR